VLPYSDIEEAERIMKDFTNDFQEHGMGGIEAAIADDSKSEECVEFRVMAGLAQGKPQIEIESVMEFARFNQNNIAQFKCARGGKA